MTADGDRKQTLVYCVPVAFYTLVRYRGSVGSFQSARVCVCGESGVQNNSAPRTHTHSTGPNVNNNRQPVTHRLALRAAYNRLSVGSHRPFGTQVEKRREHQLPLFQASVRSTMAARLPTIRLLKTVSSSYTIKNVAPFENASTVPVVLSCLSVGRSVD